MWSVLTGICSTVTRQNCPVVNANELVSPEPLPQTRISLLMDEPFGAVDEITRKMLQSEIIHSRAVRVTIVFITHDIKEALKLGTRVMVMNKGLVEQLDTPDHIRNTPGNTFRERINRRLTFTSQSFLSIFITILFDVYPQARHKHSKVK